MESPLFSAWIGWNMLEIFPSMLSMYLSGIILGPIRTYLETKWKLTPSPSKPLIPHHPIPKVPKVPNPRHRALSPQLPQQLQGFLPLPCRRAADHHATQGLVAGHVASLLHLLKSSARRNPSQSHFRNVYDFFCPGVQRFCPIQILIPCFAEHKWDMESSTITTTPPALLIIGGNHLLLLQSITIWVVTS